MTDLKIRAFSRGWSVSRSPSLECFFSLHRFQPFHIVMVMVAWGCGANLLAVWDALFPTQWAQFLFRSATLGFISLFLPLEDFFLARLFPSPALPECEFPSPSSTLPPVCFYASLYIIPPPARSIKLFQTSFFNANFGYCICKQLTVPSTVASVCVRSLWLCVHLFCVFARACALLVMLVPASNFEPVWALASRPALLVHLCWYSTTVVRLLLCFYAGLSSAHHAHEDDSITVPWKQRLLYSAPCRRRWLLGGSKILRWKVKSIAWHAGLCYSCSGSNSAVLLFIFLTVQQSPEGALQSQHQRLKQQHACLCCKESATRRAS